MGAMAADSREDAAFSYPTRRSNGVTLKQLKYLVGIADSGLNITSAAERLFTSQPGISKQLKQLEAELGVQLFTRKGKSLAAITPAGREVITRARKILREVGNITSLASDLTAELDGTLSIATTHTQARYVLPEVIRAFRERYPRVDLELHQGTSEQIAELVSTHKVDFAIATGSRDLFSNLTLLPIYATKDVPGTVEERRAAIRHKHHRFQPTQVPVTPPILGKFDACARELPRVLLEFALESLE